jgi:hypothetical protein
MTAFVRKKILVRKSKNLIFWSVDHPISAFTSKKKKKKKKTKRNTDPNLGKKVKVDQTISLSLNFKQKQSVFASLYFCFTVLNSN